MDGSTDCFASDYFAARERFLELARRRGARLATFPLKAPGPDNQPLSIDTAYWGADRPRRLLIALSGTHGVEGFAGSAIQQRWLERSDEVARDSGCLLIHAVNAYGFAWVRRTNESNVDLNRNALERFPGPANPAYARLNTWINPATPPGRLDLFWPRGAGYLITHGLAAVKQAVAGGQYEFARGLFYGGDALQESTARLDEIVSAPQFADAERVIALDIHTGLGRFATYKLLVDFASDTPPYRAMEQWFDSDKVNGNVPQGSVAYRVSGGLTAMIERRFAHAQTYAAVLEFGTVSLTRMIAALRRENRAYYYAGTHSHAYQHARAALLEVFCPGSRAWKQRVLERGERVMRQAQVALNNS